MTSYRPAGSIITSSRRTPNNYDGQVNVVFIVQGRVAWTRHGIDFKTRPTAVHRSGICDSGLAAAFSNSTLWLITISQGRSSLTNGSAAIVGTGTAWQIANVDGGTIFVQGEGNPLPLASIEDGTHATAAPEWTGATGTYSYALLRAAAFSEQLEANSNIMSRLLVGLEAGTLYRYEANGDLRTGLPSWLTTSTGRSSTSRLLRPPATGGAYSATALARKVRRLP